MIAARNISKSFPGVRANDDVTFEVRPGEVHALLGENGAGKSTLAAILTGLYTPDSGYVEIDGVRVSLKSPRHGLAHGIGMVHQHFRLVPRFTVAENISLGDRRQPWVLSAKKIEGVVGELGERYGLAINPRARVSDLTVGEQQRVEIIKTLYRGAQILLLDEPTSVLTPHEVEVLFRAIEAFKIEGKSVVFISHKLNEVMEIADRVTVMRDGKNVGVADKKSTNRDLLARLMVGREVDLSPMRASTPTGKALLQLHNLSGGAANSRGQIKGISLTVHAGEIVGIAGVSGNGQRTLAETIAGLQMPTSGSVTVCGVETSGLGSIFVRDQGLSYVPEDRNGTGLSPSLSIAENMLLTDKLPFFVKSKIALQKAAEAISTFNIKTPGPKTHIRLLSGGNVQKVLLAREIGHKPRVLVVSSPTWGLDIGAVEFVRAQLNSLRESAHAVLLISQDLDEIRALADRIYVISNGEFVYECDGEGSDLTKIGLAMAGIRPGEAR